MIVVEVVMVIVLMAFVAIGVSVLTIAGAKMACDDVTGPQPVGLVEVMLGTILAFFLFCLMGLTMASVGAI